MHKSFDPVKYNSSSLGLTFYIVDWEHVQERVEEGLNSNFLNDFQICDSNNFFKFSLVHNFAEVYCRNLFN